MYSTLTSVSSCAFSNSATTESTTCFLGSLLTSWKSQTRRVPVFSSFSEEELSDVWGEQAAAVARTAATATRRADSFMELLLRTRCSIRNTGFAVHNTTEAMEWVNHATRGLNHSVTGRRTLCNGRTAQRPPGRAKRTPEASRENTSDRPVRPGRADYLSPLP